MQNLLFIQSSPNGGHSVSTQLGKYFQQHWEQNFPHDQIMLRDLANNPVDFLTHDTISGFFSDPQTHSAEVHAALEQSESLVDELQQADIIIISAAMHNFMITAPLKAYLDQVARAGKTFEYTEQGPKGLLTGKKVYVITTAGGDYSQEPMRAMDFLTPYLTHMLAFLGLDDVEFITSYGQARGGEAAEQAQAEARQLIAQAIHSEVTELKAVAG